MTATTWKLVWVGVAAVLFGAADQLGSVELKELAAFVVGSVLMKRPGDLKE